MRQPTPYFREFDGWWYVQLRIDGRRTQQKLAKGRENEAAAWREYHRVMASPPKPQSSLRVPSDKVVFLLDEFLDHAIEVNAPTTVDWYRNFLTSFAKFVGPAFTVDDLRPAHVTDWLKKQSKWSSTTKHGAVRAIRTCFRWHWLEGRIPQYPLNGLKAPRPRRRETIVTPQEFTEVITQVKDEKFRSLLQFFYLTGCRPQEATKLQKKHVQLELNRIVFPPSLSKGQEYPRVIYLSEDARKIVAELCAHRKGPDDFVFRNAYGKPWNKNSIRCRFRRLRSKIGPMCAYHLRHSFATNALQRLDPITVSILMGHSDPSTVARTYQHLAKDPVFLTEAAQKAAGGK